MKDQRTIERVVLLHPKIREDAARAIEEAEAALNITLRVVQGLRTFAEQQAIYDQGRTKPGEIVTKSPPGASYHNYGLAIDVCPILFDEQGKVKDLNWNYDFKKLVPFFEKYGFNWGGNFTGLKDMDHFEKKAGHNWRELLDRYNKKDFIEGTQYVNI